MAKNIFNQYQHTGIHFLRVEPIWLALAEGENGWQKVESTIDALFRDYERVMIESLALARDLKGC